MDPLGLVQLEDVAAGVVGVREARSPDYIGHNTLAVIRDATPHGHIATSCVQGRRSVMCWLDAGARRLY